MTTVMLHIDFESRSMVDLKAAGVYVYAAHPSTDVTCAVYGFDDGPLSLWCRGEPCPPAVAAHVSAGGLLTAHNAAFERILWWAVLAPRYGWPKPKIEQFRCTMAKALAMALPASLENAAAAVGLDIAKDMAGHRLMLQLAKPRGMNGSTPVWWDDDARLQRLYDYCRQDVEVERALDKRLLPLSAAEQDLWFLDQRINDRGVFIDQKLCLAADRVVVRATKSLDAEMYRTTGGEVRACSEVQRLIAWLKKRGTDTDSVAKATLESLLIRDDLPDDVRRALELRKEGAKSSTAKIGALLARRNDDGRMRGNVQYHGAGTGRWAARGAQLQNLPRPVILKGKKDVHAEEQQRAIDAIMQGDPAVIEMLYDRPLTLISDCLRGMIAAPRGAHILAGDFEQIEGRVIAWLADERRKVKAFSYYDAGEGPDIYRETAASIIGARVDTVTDDERQTFGKVPELALGFGGGAGALAAMAKTYGVRLADYYEIVLKVATTEHLAKAEEGYEQRGRGSGIGEKAWLTAETIKLAWRAAHPLTVALWRGLEDAAIEAVRDPSRIVSFGRIRYRKSGSFLWCQLPSGRALCYPYPRIGEQAVPWGGTKASLHYRYVDPFSKKWVEGPTYGGSLSENVTQAVARDVMAEAMARVDAAGYPVVLTVHDEVVSEVAQDFGSVSAFEALMCQSPAWAAGLPIAAKAWRGLRYRK